MNTNRKKTDFISWILGVLLIVFGLFFVFHLFSFTELSRRMFAKRVQKAVYRADDNLCQARKDLTEAFDLWDECVS